LRSNFTTTTSHCEDDSLPPTDLCTFAMNFYSVAFEETSLECFHHALQYCVCFHLLGKPLVLIYC
jgi:hypothetical protein